MSSRLSLIELGLGPVLRTGAGGRAILRTSLSELGSLRSSVCVLLLLLLLLVLPTILLGIALLTLLLRELSLGKRLLILLILKCLGILFGGISCRTSACACRPCTVILLLLPKRTK